MPEVAKLLGVEIGEAFKIIDCDNRTVCAYNDNDVFILGVEGLYNFSKKTGKFEIYSQNYFKLVHLLTGFYEIHRIDNQKKGKGNG